MDVYTWGRDLKEVFGQFHDQIQDRGAGILRGEEPVSDYNRPYFDTEVRYVSDTAERYFEVSTDIDRSQVSEEDADKWTAMIERALIDDGLQVKIGDVHHEDNQPVSELSR